MNVLADREVLELFSDRPDLLAVADAVASTQADEARPAPRSVPLLALPAVAAVAAVVFLLLAAPWQDKGPGFDSRLFFQRALAVVGTAPVLHVVFEDSAHTTIVELATGDERPEVRRTEAWYDADRSIARFQASTDGGAPTAYIVRDPMWNLPDPAFAGFTTQYRDALASGRARIVGDANVGGRPAKIIEFTPVSASASVEQVTVDAETFVPLTVTYTSHGGRSSTVLHILRIESLPYRKMLFAPGKTLAGNPPVAQVAEEREASVPEATLALGRAPLGIDRTPDSLKIGTAKAGALNGPYAKGTVIELTYGDLELFEARDPAGIAALGVERGFNPLPPEGSVAVWAGVERAFAWTERDDIVVWLRDASKAQLLDAARALQPLNP